MDGDMRYALIRVLRAGVCCTHLEILQGYVGFRGVLGHEFVGIVEEANGDEVTQQKWIRKRVCNDITGGCASCSVYNNADDLDRRWSQMSRNHCPNRSVLGVLKRNGTMAEYLTLPITNLHMEDDNVPDEAAVVFAEFIVNVWAYEDDASI